MQIQKKTRAERIELAKQICAEIEDSLGDDLRAFVIYASVAKDADGPYSDLEMMAITTDRYMEHCTEFMRDGIRCEVDFVPLGSAIEQARKIDAQWPIAADQWHRFNTIYVKEGDDCISSIRAAALQSLEEMEKFTHEIIMAMLVGYEEIGKMLNARERKVNSDLATGLTSFATTVLRLVGFVNHHFYESMRGAWEESRKLPNLPKDYARLTGLVQGEVASSMETRYNAALELWNRIEKWAEEQGINWQKQDLELPKKKEI